MTLKADLLAQKAHIEAQLAVLNGAPNDTYNFGTIALFAANNNVKWYYVKTAEETWKNIDTSEEKALSEWILFATESNVGYFEVYILTVPASPIYAKP